MNTSSIEKHINLIILNIFNWNVSNVKLYQLTCIML
jgi:hypothetical protein